MFGRKSLIQKLCERSGVHFRFRDGPCFHVYQPGQRRGDYTAIKVVYQPHHVWTKFTCLLPVRFPLDRTPDGLFARAMIRSLSLGYTHWLIEIAERCDASLYLLANTPTEWLTPRLFGEICKEMGDEAESFHQEIQDRFNYAGRSGGGFAAAAVRQTGPGVPMRRPGSPPQRYP